MLTVTLRFDLKDNSFGLFCEALLNGGFEETARALATGLLEEGKRRKVPVAFELEAAIQKRREASDGSN
jgi:hypothetical protein